MLFSKVAVQRLSPLQDEDLSQFPLGPVLHVLVLFCAYNFFSFRLPILLLLYKATLSLSWYTSGQLLESTIGCQSSLFDLSRSISLSVSTTISATLSVLWSTVLSSCLLMLSLTFFVPSLAVWCLTFSQVSLLISGFHPIG